MSTFDVNRALADWLKTNRLITMGLLLIALIGIGFEFYLPYLNGPPEERRIYAHVYDFWLTWPRALLWIFAGLLTIGAGVGAVRAGLSRPGPRRAATLAGLILFGLYYHWLTTALFIPDGLTRFAHIILDPMTTSYYTVAQKIGTPELPAVGETLRRYPELMPGFPLHATTHPPGPVLACYGMHRLFETHPGVCSFVTALLTKLGLDPAWFTFKVSESDKVAATALGVLIALAGVLGAAPLYGLIRAALKGKPEAEATAWCAAVLWVVYPALIVAEPEFDQVYATLTLSCLYCAVRGLNERPAAWGVGVGLSLMLMIFLSFTMLFVIPMLALLALLELARRADCWRPGAMLRQADPARPDGRRLWILIGVVVLVGLAVELLLRTVWEIRLDRIFFAALRFQKEVLLPAIGRPYRTWLFFNLYDFLFYAGPVAAVLALAALGRAVRDGWRTPRMVTPAWAVFPLTLVALDISGLTPGETARIWLFLAPGVAWGAAAELVRRSGERWRVNLAVVLLAQSAFYYLCHCKLKLLH